ncbi:hypothetical protein ACD591_01840 [Rufibacter glacialis]|uniref:Uncharacterized protein n=1 Tax=Rufibacter glacialis TaxID=1259555 RepID=A0A5M8QLW6_9BACT|nr:hypothetical protein [Rufibacter glacialis]KAA6435633.1 hypothetical protein FOE74_06740 [Rufibacter glacialis]
MVVLKKLEGDVSLYGNYERTAQAFPSGVLPADSFWFVFFLYGFSPFTSLKEGSRSRSRFKKKRRTVQRHASSVFGLHFRKRL